LAGLTCIGIKRLTGMDIAIGRRRVGWHHAEGHNTPAISGVKGTLDALYKNVCIRDVVICRAKEQ